MNERHLSPLDQILSRLQGVTPTTNGFIALCPSHDDIKPSLPITGVSVILVDHLENLLVDPDADDEEVDHA